VAREMTMLMSVMTSVSAIQVNSVQRVTVILYQKFEGDLSKLPETDSEVYVEISSNWNLFNRLDDDEKVFLLEALAEDVEDIPGEILENSFELINDAMLMGIVTEGNEEGNFGNTIGEIVKKKYDLAVSCLKEDLIEVEPTG